MQRLSAKLSKGPHGISEKSGARDNCLVCQLKHPPWVETHLRWIEWSQQWMSSERSASQV